MWGFWKMPSPLPQTLNCHPSGIRLLNDQPLASLLVGPSPTEARAGGRRGILVGRGKEQMEKHRGSVNKVGGTGRQGLAGSVGNWLIYQQ